VFMVLNLNSQHLSVELTLHLKFPLVQHHHSKRRRVFPSFVVLIAVHHQWSLRLEFLTSIAPETETEEETPTPASPPDLLELVERDDRASTFMATETLHCDAFDCRVPIVVLPTNQEIPEDRVRVGGFVV
jgi:hypothetical protein